MEFLFNPQTFFDLYPVITKGDTFAEALCESIGWLIWNFRLLLTLVILLLLFGGLSRVIQSKVVIHAWWLSIISCAIWCYTEGSIRGYKVSDTTIFFSQVVAVINAVCLFHLALRAIFKPAPLAKAYWIKFNCLPFGIQLLITVALLVCLIMTREPLLLILLLSTIVAVRYYKPKQSPRSFQVSKLDLLPIALITIFVMCLLPFKTAYVVCHLDWLSPFFSCENYITF